jgi:hypothetical protein
MVITLEDDLEGVVLGLKKLPVKAGFRAGDP